MPEHDEYRSVSLDEFVAESLEQIFAGVRRAQAAVAQSGGRINPQIEIGANKVPTYDYKTATAVHSIEFDIAVTVSGSSKKGGGLRVAAFGVGGNVDGSAGREHSAVSRIKFSIPVVLPKQVFGGAVSTGGVPSADQPA